MESFDDDNKILDKIYAAFKTLDRGLEITSNIFEKFKLFVETYNKFRNEFSLSFDDVRVAEIYESIKRYKLASSEGINKVGNRVIRFEILYKVCIASNDDIKNNLLDLSNRFDTLLKSKQTSFDQFEEDDLIDVSEES